jgi:hypothetical protein
MTGILEHVTIKIVGIVNGYMMRDSVMIDDVLPEKFWMVAEVMLVTSFASTHLVKYSTAIMAKV